MKGRLSTCLFLIVSFNLLIGYDQTVFGQDQEAIKVETVLLNFPVFVSDKYGKPLKGLTKDDFELSINGQKQKIELFEATRPAITVFLLLDRSSSMSVFKAEVASAANSFVEQMKGEDTLIAASFANEVDVLVSGKKVKDIKKHIKIRQFREDNNTMLFDAVDFALKKMSKITGRKALIIFSDGGGTPFISTAKSNFKNAVENEALIYTIQYNTFSEPSPYANKRAFYESIEEANTYMRALPEITGGRYYSIEKIDDLASVFAEIINDLSRQYLLGYYRKDKDGNKGQRKIQVTVNRQNVSVSSRKEVTYR